MAAPSTGRLFPELSPQEEEKLRYEARERSKEDLHYLAKHLLGYDKITDHYHKQMAYDVDTPQYRFKLLLHARGHFKSTLGTESRAIQKLLRDARERILITNAKLDNSRKFLRTISGHFNHNPKLRWVWRDYWIDKYATPYHRHVMKDKLDWVVRDVVDELILLRPDGIREASVTTGAVDASLVSQHYSTIIADDLINREYVRSLEMVEKSILYFKDLLDLLDPDGELIVIGTRWAHYDLYKWIMDEFGFKSHFRVPENYVDPEILQRAQQTPDENKEWLVSIQPATKNGEMDGDPVFPEEFNRQVLENLLTAKGPYEFGAQYLLNPTPKEHQKFKDEWFRKIDTLPDPKVLKVCITVDPNASKNEGADHTAIVVCGYDDYNRMYLLDGLDESLGTDEVPEAVFEFVQKWHARAKFLYPVGMEAIGFMETYQNTIERMMLERGFFFSIEPIKRRDQSKDDRIYGLVPRVKAGFYVPRSLTRDSWSGRCAPYDLTMRIIVQLTQYPHAGKDDLADALADQLKIVHANALPGEVRETAPTAKPEFTHWSIHEDRVRRQMRRMRGYSDAVR